jgi:hypothetical protein
MRGTTLLVPAFLQPAKGYVQVTTSRSVAVKNVPDRMDVDASPERAGYDLRRSTCGVSAEDPGRPPLDRQTALAPAPQRPSATSSAITPMAC